MRILCLILALILPTASWADQIDDLFAALQGPASVSILRDEGMANAAEMEQWMLGRPTSARWARGLESVYDVTRMETRMRAGFRTALEGVDIAPLLAFYRGPIGSRMVALELSARQAFLLSEVEEDARATWRQGDGGPHATAIDDFIRQNDLIERNVTGALNSNHAFLVALAQGAPDLETRTEPEILRDIWDEADGIRADTDEWMHAFLTMAWAPLSPQDVAAVMTLSNTPEGQALNHALFAGFDVMFEEVSHLTGLAIAGLLGEQDL